MFAASTVLQAYVGYCPSCGHRIHFAEPLRDGYCEAVTGLCTGYECGRRWSFVFDLDESGTFGVMSFQCDNEDRR